MTGHSSICGYSSIYDSLIAEVEEAVKIIFSGTGSSKIVVKRRGVEVAVVV